MKGREYERTSWKPQIKFESSSAHLSTKVTSFPPCVINDGQEDFQNVTTLTE